MMVKPQLVSVHYPAERCGACGDKIKDDWMWRAEDRDGTWFFHESCADADGKPIAEER